MSSVFDATRNEHWVELPLPFAQSIHSGRSHTHIAMGRRRLNILDELSGHLNIQFLKRPPMFSLITPDTRRLYQGYTPGELVLLHASLPAENDPKLFNVEHEDGVTAIWRIRHEQKLTSSERGKKVRREMNIPLMSTLFTMQTFQSRVGEKTTHNLACIRTMTWCKIGRKSIRIEVARKYYGGPFKEKVDAAMFRLAIT